MRQIIVMFKHDDDLPHALHDNVIEVNNSRQKHWLQTLKGLSIEKEGDFRYPRIMRQVERLIVTCSPVGAHVLDNLVNWVSHVFGDHVKDYWFTLAYSYS